MALLAEFAITPDVFDATSYANEEVGQVRLEGLTDILLNESIVRDLRDGEWWELFQSDTRAWHKEGKELIKKLAQQNRLRKSHAVLKSVPISDTDWCREALASRINNRAVDGVISTAPIYASMDSDPKLARIDKLNCAQWWQGRTSSVMPARKSKDYQEYLHLIMRCANSVMFIDPHLDPTVERYENVISLIRLAEGRRPPPRIEIHRVCYVGSGRRTQLPDWQAKFRKAWSWHLAQAKQSVEIYIWDDFHDRHLITDLLGIQMGNGFDVTRKHKDRTTWTRLSRPARDSIQREFDPAENQHVLQDRFTLPY